MATSVEEQYNFEDKNCFDFLRVIFCAIIILSHLYELSECASLSFLSFFYDKGILGLQAFFIISGFLVAKSYQRTSTLKKYFIKRAKRLFPAYIFLLLLTVIGMSIFSKYGFFDYFTNTDIYKYFVWNIMFLNFMHPCLPGIFENNLLCAVNGALWTLKVEESFYIFLPFIFYLIRKTKKATVVIMIIYFLSLLYWYVMDEIFDKPLLAKQMPGYLVFFSVGIFLNLNLKYVLKHSKQLFLMAIISLLLTYFFRFQINFLYPASFGLLIIIIAYNFPLFNGFGKYGDFTYGLYIYHFPIIQLFRQYDLFNKYNAIVMAIVVVLITLFFAVFSWVFVEKRFLDRFKSNNKKITPSYAG
nr:acyltransferase [uncultured Flavobacterium sp.]